MDPVVKVTIFVTLAALFTCVLSQATVERPSIEKTIEKETKAAGQVGMLNCTLLNKGTNKVVWQKLARTAGAKNILISTDTTINYLNPEDTSKLEKYRVFVTRISQVKEVWTLSVRNLQDVDTGTYECYLMMLGETADKYPRAVGELVVQLPPSIIEATVTTTVQVAVGETAVLRCTAKGVPEPRISWSRANGKPLFNDEITFHGEVLTIPNTTSFDRGTYRCKAENNVKPPDLVDVTLDVFYKPTLIPFRRSVGQQPGRNYEVRLSCRVSGNPEPVARWFRKEGIKETELQNSEKYRVDKLRWLPGSTMKVGDFWYELVIRNVGDGDRGLYQCSAANTYGESRENITLFMTTTCQTWKCWIYTDIGGAARANTVSVLVLLSLGALAVLAGRYTLG